jgi:hypothetical protein
VPKGVLIVDPPVKDFHIITDGFEAAFVATAKNHGLIEMTDLEITGADVNGGRLTPMITYFPRLGPQEVVEVPFVFSYHDPAQQGQQGLETRQAPSGGDIAGCIVGALPFGGALDANVAAGLAAIFQARERCVRDLNPQSAFASIAALFAFAQVYNLILGPPFIAGTLAQIVGCIVGHFLPLSFAFDIGEGGGRGGGADYSGTIACFAPGTPIWMADGTHKPIECVKIDDWVRTGAEKGKVARVGEIFERRSGRLRELMLEDPLGMTAGRSLRATAEHLIWVDGKGWRPAEDLRIGDWVFDETGRRLRVAANRLSPETLTVHTVRLKGDNAFYAGGILVHDLCGPLPPEAALVTREDTP